MGRPTLKLLSGRWCKKNRHLTAELEDKIYCIGERRNDLTRIIEFSFVIKGQAEGKIQVGPKFDVATGSKPFR